MALLQSAVDEVGKNMFFTRYLFSTRIPGLVSDLDTVQPNAVAPACMTSLAIRLCRTRLRAFTDRPIMSPPFPSLFDSCLYAKVLFLPIAQKAQSTISSCVPLPRESRS